MTDILDESVELAESRQWWQYGLKDNPNRWDRSKHNFNTVQVQGGKEVVPAKELLNYAHKSGLVKIEQDLVQFDWNEGYAVVRATAYFSDGTSFTEYGDASQDNTNKMTSNAFIRMAATRAVSRALTMALNVDTNAAEEMGPSGGGDNQRSSFRGNTSRAAGTSRGKSSSSDDDWDD